MKRLLTTLLLVCAVMTAADVAAQSLLRTHVRGGRFSDHFRKTVAATMFVR